MKGKIENKTALVGVQTAAATPWHRRKGYALFSLSYLFLHSDMRVVVGMSAQLHFSRQSTNPNPHS